jgi:glutamyl-tRNA synthetase
MHVGGVRTAIYAWLFAKKHQGEFILRIEDTDKNREVDGSIEHIQESLRWLGLNWDQGPIKQSDRLAVYKKWALTLIENGHAYPDPYTEEEIETFRTQAEEAKLPYLYRNHRPETFGVWDGTKPLRFKVPEIKRYVWEDMVRGELSAGEEALDDFILMKSDGYPTYNFAHIIDDHDMDVTHIMRGEEFISSTPKFLSLYDALGFQRPEIATMPVILGPDGKKKLSKRDGAKDILDYRTEGYLPEAMVNFLALLGWHPGNDKEVMSIDELVELFDVTKLQKGGAKFDEDKLHWIDHKHIEQRTDEEFETLVCSYIQSQQRSIPTYLNTAVAAQLKNRSHTLSEAEEVLRGEFSFLHEEFATPSKELMLQGAKAEAPVVKAHLQKLSELLENCEVFTDAGVKDFVFPYATEVGRASVLWPMRVALSGMEKSPDPFILAGLLGKLETQKRIEKAAQLF